MQLLSPVININQKQIIKQQILYKIILVISFLISNYKALDLESNHPAHHIGIVRITLYHKDIFKLMVVKHLKEMRILE